MKAFAKTFFNTLFLVLLWPAGLLTGFGRLHAVYTILAHVMALFPGVIGDYIRRAYYRWTLDAFGISSRISFGSYFAHPQASVGERVSIGAYTILGKCVLETGCRIAGHSQVLSGQHQHRRGPDGAVMGSESGIFRVVRISSGAWIGAGVIVMADVGRNVIVGAGSVVSKALPDNCTAVGVPAKPLASAWIDTAEATSPVLPPR
jgi:virginiamycin A acetyltransferase